MPLPKISTPTYELVLPSNNKKVKYPRLGIDERKNESVNCYDVMHTENENYINIKF